MKYRFKLVAGHYAVGGNNAVEKNGKRVSTSDATPFKLYSKGDIVESDQDLAAKCNSPGSVKFQRLDGNNDPELMTMDQLLEQQRQIESAIAARESTDPPEDGLEDLTVAELRELSLEKPDVDLTGLTKKDDIIDAIRSSSSLAEA